MRFSGFSIFQLICEDFRVNKGVFFLVSRENNIFNGFLDALSSLDFKFSLSHSVSDICFSDFQDNQDNQDNQDIEDNQYKQDNQNNHDNHDNHDDHHNQVRLAQL